MPVKIQRKPRTHRIAVPDRLEHGEAGELVEAISGINKGDTFTSLHRLWPQVIGIPRDRYGELI